MDGFSVPKIEDCITSALSPAGQPLDVINLSLQGRLPFPSSIQRKDHDLPSNQVFLGRFRSLDNKRVYSRLVCGDSGRSTPNESGIDSKANESIPDSFAAVPPRATPICHPPGRSTPNESISRLVWPCWTPSKANESGIDLFVAIPVARHQTSLFQTRLGRFLSLDTKRVWNRLVWGDSGCSTTNESIPDLFVAIPVVRHQTSLFQTRLGQFRLLDNKRVWNRLVWGDSGRSTTNGSIPDSFVAIPVVRHQTSLE
ncbi:hypothetical protein GGU11DRAFT_824455 [Lentinula aff. detonsa]|nr:hypothetical protein GGU11DRAFT_824455 [Lentinula aff. detonsa]